MQKNDRDYIQELCRQWCANNALDETIENILAAADVLGFLRASNNVLPCPICGGVGGVHTLEPHK